MPDIQAGVTLAWGSAAPLAAGTSLAWGDAAPRQSLGAPYTRPAPGTGTPIIEGENLAPTRDIGPASFYVAQAALAVQDLRTGLPLPVSAVQMQLPEGSDIWDLQATGPSALADALEAGEQPALLQVEVGASMWRFVVETIDRPQAFNSPSVTVRGLSLASLAGQPYQPQQDWITDAPTTAAQICAIANTFTNVAVQWLAPDWPVPAGAWSTSADPLGVVRQVAAAIRAEVEAHPSEYTLLVRPRYPVAPNLWATTPPDWQVAWEAVETARQERQDRPAYDGVLVAGQGTGGAALVRLAGTAGSVQAPMVTNALLTDPVAQAEAGAAILWGYAGRTRETRTLQVYDQVIQRGALVRFVDPTATWVGMVRGVSVQATLESARQTVTVERPTSFAAGSSAPPPLPPAPPPPPPPAPPGQSFVWLSGSQLRRTTDAGVTLSAAESLGSGTTNHFLNASAADGGQIIGGTFGLRRRVGGAWVDVSPQLPASSTSWALAGRPGLLAAARFDSVASLPHVSTDGGATWAPVGTNLAASRLLYCEASGLFLMSLFPSGTLQSSPDMVTRTTRTGTNHILIGCVGATVLAAPSSFSGVFVIRRSTDGGLSWSSITTSVPAPSFGSVSGSGNPAGIWIANTPGSALRSSNNGVSWSALTSPDPGLSMGLSLWTGTEFIWVLFGTTTSKLFASPDGLTWTLRQEISGNFAGLFPAAPIGA